MNKHSVTNTNDGDNKTTYERLLDERWRHPKWPDRNSSARKYPNKEKLI